MKPVITPVRDPVLQKNFASIRECLGGRVSIDNMQFQVIEGTTADTPDTEYLLQHSMTPRPIAWFPLLGDIYVQSISDNYIDVRATKPAVNFRLIAIAGDPVTGLDLTNVGGSAYKDTTQYIQETPVTKITVTNPFTVEATSIDFNVGQLLGSLTLNSPAVHACAPYTDSFLVTSWAGSIPSTAASELQKFSRSDGTRTNLTLGADGLGKVLIQGNTAYVSETRTTGTVKIYVVDIPTMTLSTTWSGTGSATYVISDFILDATHFYVSGGTSGGSGVIEKYPLGGGARIGVISAGAAGTEYGNMIDTGTFIYLPVMGDTTVVSRILKITKSSFTGSNIDSPNWRCDIGCLTLINNTLYTPFGYTTSRTSAGSIGRWFFGLMAYDIGANSWTQIPMPCSGNQGTSLLDQVAFDGTYLYFMSIPATSANSGINMYRYNPSTNTLNMAFFPVFMGGSIQVFPNTMIQYDSVEQKIIAIPVASTIGSAAFNYFYPDFSAFDA